MNSLTIGFRTLKKRLATHALLNTQLLVSAFFIMLMVFFHWSTVRFWETTQKPRLYKVAETQAQILADLKSSVLVEVLETTDEALMAVSLRDEINKMLIAEDPAIGQRFINAVSLQIDYSTLKLAEGSLDIHEGNRDCGNCFHASILLTGEYGEILGVAEFVLSGGYFERLVEEMQPKLFAETNTVLLVVLLVWGVVLVLFQRLHLAKTLLEESDSAKSRFIANVTHELRTPLNAILGYTQLYKSDRQLMASHGKGIETIDRSADHLLLMINDILEFSRVHQEAITLVENELDLKDFLTTIVEMIGVRAKIKGLHFSFEFAPDLPRMIRADGKRLRQVLLNILGNAVKFTERGNVHFSVQCMVGHRAQRTLLRCKVEDQGIGIDKKQLHSIFIPYKQLHNAMTQAEGTGLGLAITQHLLSVMGSKLHVSSEVNKGTVFWFDIGFEVMEQQGFIELDPVLEPVSLLLPDQEWLQSFKKHAKRHSVLGIRELLTAIETVEPYAEFIRQVTPFVSQYRFKPMLEWLEQLENNH